MGGLKLKYFVLRPESKKPYDEYALASRQALRAYADAIESVNKELAFDLRLWIKKEAAGPEEEW